MAESQKRSGLRAAKSLVKGINLRKSKDGDRIMPYYKKTVKAGNRVIEVTRSFSSRLGTKGTERGTNLNATPEDVKKINEQKAEEKLRWIMLSNFQADDLHVVLTIRKENQRGIEETKKRFRKFLNDLRRDCRLESGTELKYISVTEYKGKKGTNFHHHLLIPYMDIRILKKLWGYGTVRFTPIRDDDHLCSLAHYFVKETKNTFNTDERVYSKRWNASRNLKKPEIKIEIINSKKWRDTPKPKKGYYIDKDSVVNQVNEQTGMPYQFYRMIRINERKIPIDWDYEKRKGVNRNGKQTVS